MISCFRNNIPSRLLLAEVMELPNLLLTLLVNEIEDAVMLEVFCPEHKFLHDWVP